MGFCATAKIVGPLALLCSTLAACGVADGAADGKGGRKPTVPQVGFVVAQATTVPLEIELPGRIAALQTAQVRPQITGVIQARLFTEGSFVRAGQPLYRIDASLYRAAAAQAEANLAAASANASAAAARAARFRPLAADQAIAQQDYTDAAASARALRASVAQTRAALDTARINLRFTTVPAPISGRIGRSLITQGGLVTAGQAGPLAEIAVLDPVYVDLQQGAADRLKLARALGSNAGGAQVRLLLDDGSEYPVPGQLSFSEVTVDPATGTVTMRAKFPNPQSLLLPGMFVRAKLVAPAGQRAWLIPQEAVSHTARGSATVLVVGPDGKALLRDVAAPRTSGAFWVVTGGLADGDKVITQGLGKAKPGEPVKAVPASAPQGPKKPGEQQPGKPAAGSR